MDSPVLCSLNEIQTLATKAARGAGLPWGVADEAGRTARWLESRGLGGLAALAAALDSLAVPDWSRFFPVPAGACWRGRDGGIEGLLAGIAIADRAGPGLPFAGEAGGALVLDAVHRPLLAMPFLAGTAEACGVSLGVSTGAGGPAIRLGPQGISATCRTVEGLALAPALRIERDLSPAAPAVLPRLDGSIPVEDAVYACLDKRAWQTYVPESAESQARGAGGSTLIETD